VICSSFIIKKLDELLEREHVDCKCIAEKLKIQAEILNMDDSERKKYIKEKLQELLENKFAAKEQLRMFLTGIGGGGKTHTLKHCYAFCKKFCDTFQLDFNESTMKFTAIPGQAAAFFPNGQTTHSAIQINTENLDTVWKNL